MRENGNWLNVQVQFLDPAITPIEPFWNDTIGAIEQSHAQFVGALINESQHDREKAKTLALRMMRVMHTTIKTLLSVSRLA